MLIWFKLLVILSLVLKVILRLSIHDILETLTQIIIVIDEIPYMKAWQSKRNILFF